MAEQRRCHPALGSRLNQVHQMSIEASAMVELKFLASLS